MILIGTVAIAVLAVALSELTGRSRVVYARMAGLIGSFVAAVGAVFVVSAWRGWQPGAALAMTASAVPLMAAWLGFRIHLTNSISLELATLLAEHGPCTATGLRTAYDVPTHIATRVRILRDAGYLTADAAALTVESPRMRWVMRGITILCGQEGPRAVAARLDAAPECTSAGLSNQRSTDTVRLASVDTPDAWPRVAWRIVVPLLLIALGVLLIP